MIGKILSYLDKCRSSMHIFVLGVNADNARNKLQDKYHNLNFSTAYKEQILSFNQSISFKLNAFIEEFEIWVVKKIQQLELFQNSMVEDLLYNDDSKLETAIKSIRSDIKTGLAERKDVERKLKNIKTQLREYICALESLLIELGETPVPTRIDCLSIDEWKIAEKYFLLQLEFVETGIDNALDKTIQLAADMRKGGYPYADILDLYLAKIQNKDIDACELGFLRQHSGDSNEFIHRACIRFRSELKLNTREAGMHAAAVECRSPDEWCALGLWRQSMQMPNAESILRRAFLAGSEEAGQALLKANGPRTLRFLATSGHAKAAYILAGLSRSRVDSEVFLKISAAAGYSDAILKLAKIELGKEHAENAVRLYRHIYQKNKILMKLDDLEQYGRALYCTARYPEAMKILLTCQSGWTFRLRGEMFEKGWGTEINMASAKNLYAEAVTRGDRDAKILLEKIQHRELERMVEQMKSTSYEPSYTKTGSSSSSWCFLTTATCLAQKLPDDCEVLRTFRWYRDNILLREEGGKELVAAYYRLAPQIVNEIDGQPDAESIYLAMWGKYIFPCYVFLKNGHFDEAKNLYITLVRHLEAIYIVKNMCNNFYTKQ